MVLGNPEAKKHLVVIGNLHAREYMTTQLCMSQIEYYLKNYDKKINGEKVSKVLDKVAIHYVPSCNPDGTAISQFGFNAIRDKELRAGSQEDAGQQHPLEGQCPRCGSEQKLGCGFPQSGKTRLCGFHGSRAASEPEVKHW